MLLGDRDFCEVFFSFRLNYRNIRATEYINMTLAFVMMFLSFFFGNHISEFHVDMNQCSNIFNVRYTGRIISMVFFGIEQYVRSYERDTVSM